MELLYFQQKFGNPKHKKATYFKGLYKVFTITFSKFVLCNIRFNKKSRNIIYYNNLQKVDEKLN